MKGVQGQILDLQRDGKSIPLGREVAKMKTEAAPARKTVVPTKRVKARKVSEPKEPRTDNRGKKGVDHEVHKDVALRFAQAIISFGHVESDGTPDTASLREELLKYLGSEKCPVKTTLDKWVKGGSTPNRLTERYLMSKGINLNWLSTGLGSMFLGQTEQPEKQQPLEEPQLHESESAEFDRVIARLLADSDAIAELSDYAHCMEKATQAKARLAERLVRKSA